MFHRHNWIEQERFHTASNALTRFKNMDPRDVERFVFGVTTILYRCDPGNEWQKAGCGATRKEEILGK